MEGVQPTNKDVIFTWKNTVFCTYTIKSELFLKWRILSPHVTKNHQVTDENNESELSSSEDEFQLEEIEHKQKSGTSDYDFMAEESIKKDNFHRSLKNPYMESFSSPENTQRFSCHKDNLKSRDPGMGTVFSSSLQLHIAQDCELKIIAVRFTFDEILFQRFPVILLECVTENFDVSYKFIQVRDKTTRLFDFNHSVSSRGDTGLDSHSNFTLVPVDSYQPGDLNHDSEACWSSTKSFLLSGCKLSLIRILPGSVCLVLYNHAALISKSKSSLSGVNAAHNSVQEFIVTDDCENVSDVHILDSCCIEDDGTSLLVLMSLISPDESAKFKCVCFVPTGQPGSCSFLNALHLVSVPVETFFPQHYEEIIKVASILSLVSSLNEQLKTVNYFSSVITLTHTGYALKFKNGSLLSCVNLFSCGASSHTLKPERWSCDVVKIMGFGDSLDRAAVQVESYCILIDWAGSKIIHRWQGIQTILECDLLSCGVSSLLLVFRPREDAGKTPQGLRQLLADVNMKVVDPLDSCLPENNFPDQKKRLSHRPNSGVPSRLEFANQPQCALKALLCQRKRCDEAVAELESQLKSKLSFLSETWQHLSNPAGVDLSPQLPQARGSSNQNGLVVLVNGVVPPDHHQNSTPESGKFTKCSHVWTRVIDSLLVAGVEVRNISESSLTDISLNLLPVSECLTNILETSSRSGVPGIVFDITNLTSQLANPATPISGSQRNGGGLQPGQSIVLTCVCDMSHSQPVAGLTCHVFLSYTIQTGDEWHGTGFSSNTALFHREVHEFCCELVISQDDLLNGTHSLGKKTDSTETQLSIVDILALDSVQTSWTLRVDSVVSSVSCLSAQLHHQELIHFQGSAQQFVLITGDCLRFCRIQLLEQANKHTAKIKMYARCTWVGQLLVKFLYSLLPEDITLTVDATSEPSLVEHTEQSLLHDVNNQILLAKQQIQLLDPAEFTVSEKTREPLENPRSPTFGSSKNVRKQETSGSDTAGSTEQDKWNIKRDSSYLESLATTKEEKESSILQKSKLRKLTTRVIPNN